jgi:hypothetical protein
VDVTGVGRPVFDLLREALRDHRCRLHAVTFTAQDRIGSPGATELKVGKPWMVSRLQALLATRRVQLPALNKQAAALRRELETYEIRVSDDARLTAGAFKTGAHDDLATALGLAVLFDSRAGEVVKVANPFR